MLSWCPDSRHRSARPLCQTCRHDAQTTYERVEDGALTQRDLKAEHKHERGQHVASARAHIEQHVVHLVRHGRAQLSKPHGPVSSSNAENKQQQRAHRSDLGLAEHRSCAKRGGIAMRIGAAESCGAQVGKVGRRGVVGSHADPVLLQEKL